MSDSLKVQFDIKRNAEELQKYALDLNNWEDEMKAKEQQLLSSATEIKQNLPPPRNKKRCKDSKKQVCKEEEKKPKRISSYDYSSWEKFDIEKACKDVDNEDSGSGTEDNSVNDESETPPRESGKTEQVEPNADKLKMIDQAFYEKELGNQFVRKSQWKEAIQCYTKAIEYDSNNSIYYANRALCFIKLSNFKSAEVDSTIAIQLDKNYVKAYQRRGFARSALGQLTEAKADYEIVLELEPSNVLAKTELAKIDKKLASAEETTKNTKPEPSFNPKNIFEKKPEKSEKPGDAKKKKNAKIEELKARKEEVKKTEEKLQEVKVSEEKEENSEPILPRNELFPPMPANSSLVQPVKKPPHLRHKAPLQRIKVVEVITEADIVSGDKKEFGRVSEDIGKPGTVSGDVQKPENVTGDVRKPEIVSGDAEKPENVTENMKKLESVLGNLQKPDIQIKKQETEEGKTGKEGEEEDRRNPEDVNNPLDLTLEVPQHCVQFSSMWRKLKISPQLQYRFLKQIPSSNLSKIFGDSLESDLLSSVLSALAEDLPCADPTFLAHFLTGLSRVKRFSSLIMFMAAQDRTCVKKCINAIESSGKEDVTNLKKLYEM